MVLVATRKWLHPPWYLQVQQAQRQQPPQQQGVQPLQLLSKQRMHGAGGISPGTSVAGGASQAAAAAAVGVAVVEAHTLWRLGGLGSALTAARLALKRTLPTPTAVSVFVSSLAMVDYIHSSWHA